MNKHHDGQGELCPFQKFQKIFDVLDHDASVVVDVEHLCSRLRTISKAIVDLCQFSDEATFKLPAHQLVSGKKLIEDFHLLETRYVLLCALILSCNAENKL